MEEREGEKKGLSGWGVRVDRQGPCLLAGGLGGGGVGRGSEGLEMGLFQPKR
ncbi:Histone-arginine methyltransferase CARMER [Clarias magur]|uniref:Histone-arginine methyltransferase CARMER n=1 Tax=Clarias magur TaxID=1594786 RepID=A0A8J4X3U8_CLAMG|nr:Histone-arginine methyltransferase CARMER [Clarias magur]